MTPELKKYINLRYHHWLEYSTFQCSKNHIEDQAGDVLNYVLEDILTQKIEKAKVLFGNKITHKKRSGSRTTQNITELDAYILQSIKFSCIYKSSSYQLRNRNIERDVNVDLCKLSIPYTTEIDEKISKEEKLQQVEDMLYKIGISDQEIRIFKFYMFGRDFREWEGIEHKRSLSFICKRITKKLCSEINAS